MHFQELISIVWAVPLLFGIFETEKEGLEHLQIELEHPGASYLEISDSPEEDNNEEEKTD